jgi:hypothetical protein
MRSYKGFLQNKGKLLSFLAFAESFGERSPADVSTILKTDWIISIQPRLDLFEYKGITSIILHNS